MTLLRFTPTHTDTTPVTASSLTSTPAGRQAILVSNGMTGNSSTYSSDFPKNGINTIKVFAQPSSSVSIRLPFDTTDKYSGAVSFYHRVESPLASGLCIATLRYASGIALRVLVTSNNAISVQNTAGVVVANTATGVWQVGQWNRIELVATVATSTTGSFTLNVYTNESTTPTGTSSSSAGDFGTAALVGMDIGVPASVPVAFTDGVTQYFAAPTLNDGATTQNGPWIFSGFLVNHSETPGYCLVDFTGSTPSGVTHTISPTTNVTEPSEGLFFIRQLSNSQNFTVTTSDGGQSQETSITVPAVGTTSDSLRVRVFSDGVWSDS